MVGRSQEVENGIDEEDERVGGYLEFVNSSMC